MGSVASSSGSVSRSPRVDNLDERLNYIADVSYGERCQWRLVHVDHVPRALMQSL